ncbi:MAG: N(2)-acetyl-L-2,4-diaminobutanoate deacetylase DoeB [Gammaproteobacteria bacterium]|nr:N(2)-acetyl-L-2,4-diaminobutanoate deacetylase DoeB [Gammaproteobacteria bacterium]
MQPTPITTDIDYGRQGVQHGHLKLPYSHDDSAWGSIPIPITVIANGSGPTALLTGANHGDEYEGPTALSKLAGSLQAAQVGGRVIIVPFMNYPAFRAGRRTSPIDAGNMNRVFPGKPDGGITEKIADYFQRVLLPMSDFVLDLHSGGKTLEFVPFACAHVLADADQQARCVAAMHAFAAPYSMMMLELEAVGMYDTAAEEMGKVFVSTELGGGGSTTPHTIEVATTGVHNFLVYAGIKHGELVARESVALNMPDGDCYLAAEHEGLLEMHVALGERVQAGDLVARVHRTDRNGETPAEYFAKRSGLLAGRHFPGLIKPGDFLSVVGVTDD